MAKRERSALLPNNLPQLQNLIKRDPISYKEDFLQQYRHYESQLTILQLKPDEAAEEFGNLVTFISQVAQCYPQETNKFPQQLITLLSEHYQNLNPNLRKTMVKGLILLRNKEIIPIRDKQLRELLYSHIISDIKNNNAKHKNNKLNKTLQNFMYTILQNTTDNINVVAAKKSLDACVELYKKGIWNDSKTVNIISEACFHSVTKIKVTAIQFFLGSNNENQDEDSEDDDQDIPDIKRLQHINLINKTKRSKSKKLEKAMSIVKKRERQKNKRENFNFSTLHLLNDPQGFSEKLLSSLQKSSNNDRFEVKLMTMNLISRIIGAHKLILLSFYTYLQRYLKPHQRDVTMILVIVAQSCHELVPPDALEPVIKTIANNFVTDHCAGEVMAAGLNAIREICVRQPLAIDSTLLQDLTDYKSDRDKGVMMAAKSLIGLFREINPEMLKRKDRGKIASMNMKDLKPLQYGKIRTTEQIEGIELLEEYKKQQMQGWVGWEVASNASSNSGDWIDVSDDENKDDIDMNDRDDDENENDINDRDDDDDDDDENESDINNRDNDENESDINDRGDDENESDINDRDDDENESDINEVDRGDDKECENEEKNENKGNERESTKDKKISSLAMTQLLTPADFFKLNELKMKHKVKQLIDGGKRKSDAIQNDEPSDIVDVNFITGPRKKAKQDYEERIESIKIGREGREKFGGPKKGKKAEGTSTTNKEKAKNKAFMMVIHKKNAMTKKRMSLRDKQV
ncbi:SDA1-domain-containing protein [Gigaspora rosea]|uniref:Protein SDA1 n=1 Tax=Gigaspora rosea TaxID=44941 RepID=A0A397UCG7_9GLOM|nr:SDA1-domain-containing protein [Gigaspora rosea]